ncbi:GNAT family N-acetyltransferase [Herminiimonas sp. KBW02]|uniref:GNAT family N-acetyltransferase n=1 Tax=Herminiimonas sp. KBW02 TaxID=2153363 RepID=UPI000F5A05C0|nr:GNAT family N-acetyltransferase [Herminiimonas sp. KBW02]RQO38615.1 GNAT family N-acetyltransferase [Herminiimonas sp. KBW02]
MKVEVKRCPLILIETSPDLPALLAEYAAESANNEIGPVSPQLPTYRAMETAGVFYAFSAQLDGRLIGFLFLIVPVLPHYGEMVAIAESYFVASGYRKTGAATKLRKAAEDIASGLGAVGIMFSAPIGGVLEQVLPGVGYRDTARIFFKALQ